MDRRLAENIQRLGFRKWYERQLYSSHAHFVLGFLSAIAVIASVEAYRGSEGQQAGLLVMFIVVSAAIGAWALRRYSYLMMRAEEAANQASCPDCGEYGRFSVVSQRSDQETIEVRCRKCTRQWVIAGKEE